MTKVRARAFLAAAAAIGVAAAATAAALIWLVATRPVALAEVLNGW